MSVVQATFSNYSNQPGTIQEICLFILTNHTISVNQKKRWIDSNRLSRSISKSNYSIFHSSASTVLTEISIKIGKKQISREKNIKFLGPLLDEHLDGGYQIAELSKSLQKLFCHFSLTFWASTSLKLNEHRLSDLVLIY